MFVGLLSLGNAIDRRMPFTQLWANSTAYAAKADVQMSLQNRKAVVGPIEKAPGQKASERRRRRMRRR
jgi:hypothetical protein